MGAKIINYIIIVSHHSYSYFILLDNAALHKSSSTMEFVKEMGLSLLFIPSHSPLLAPIEKGFALVK